MYKHTSWFSHSLSVTNNNPNQRNRNFIPHSIPVFSILEDMRFNICQSPCLVPWLCTLTFAISSTTKPRLVTVEPQHGDFGSFGEHGDLHHLRPAMLTTYQGIKPTASPQLIPSQALNITNTPTMDAPHRNPTATAFEGNSVTAIVTVTKYLARIVTHTITETKTIRVKVVETIYQRMTRTKSVMVCDGSGSLDKV